ASGELLDVLEELAPGLRRRLLALLDALDRLAGRVFEVALVRSEDLRPQLQRRGREHLAYRSVAEERVAERLHRRALQQRGLARQVARLPEDVRLRRGRG